MFALSVAIICLFAVISALMAYPLITQQQSGLAGVCVSILFTVCFGLYYALGDAGGYIGSLERQSKLAAIKKTMLHLRSPVQVIVRMQKHLQSHPQSAKGWFLLGRLHLSLNDYAAAVEAFDKAHHLKQNDPDYLMQSVQAHFLLHARRLSKKDIILLQGLLQKIPHHPAALNLLAVHAFREGRYSAAIDAWQEALEQMQPGSEEQKLILQSIAKAHKKRLAH